MTRVRPFTGIAESRVYPRTPGVERPYSPPTDVMPPHDLEQTGVIGEAQRLRGARDVPVVPLQGGDDDLAFRLGLERLEGRGSRPVARAQVRKRRITGGSGSWGPVERYSGPEGRARTSGYARGLRSISASTFPSESRKSASQSS